MFPKDYGLFPFSKRFREGGRSLPTDLRTFDVKVI